MSLAVALWDDPSWTAPPTTVSLDVVGTPAISGSSANILTTANAPISPSGFANSVLCALVTCSHINSSPWSSYIQLSCTSSVGGALTRLSSTSINVDSNVFGSAHLFYRLAPTAGAQNLTATYQLPSGAWGDRIRIIPFVLYNVNQSTPFGTGVTAGATGTINVTVSTSATTSMVLYGSASATSPTGFNQNQLMSYFSVTDNGYGDYTLLGNATGGFSRTFTTTNSGIYGAWAVEALVA